MGIGERRCVQFLLADACLQFHGGISMSTTFSSTTFRFSDCGWQSAWDIDFGILKCAKNSGELGGLSSLCVHFHVFPGLVLVAVAVNPSPGNLVGCVCLPYV